MKTNRRRFIQTAAVSTAAVAGISGADVSASQAANTFSLNPTPLKLGLMTYQVGQSWDIPTLIKNCKETRFEHVQLRTTHKHGVELALSKAQRAEVKQRFADAGLAISLASAYQFHSPDQTELGRNIEGAKQFLQLAADVGALGPGRSAPGGDRESGSWRRAAPLRTRSSACAENDSKRLSGSDGLCGCVHLTSVRLTDTSPRVGVSGRIVNASTATGRDRSRFTA